MYDILDGELTMLLASPANLLGPFWCLGLEWKWLESWAQKIHSLLNTYPGWTHVRLEKVYKFLSTYERFYRPYLTLFIFIGRTG